MLDEIADKYEEAYKDMTLFALADGEGGLPRSDRTEYWIKAETAVTRDIPPLVTRLRDHFRALLGVDTGPTQAASG